MKKFSVYEIQGDVTPDELIAHITDSENVFRDFSSSLDTITGGFLPLYEEIDANGGMQPKYYVSVGGNLMTFAYKMLKKNVPAAQVKDVFEKRIQEILLREGRVVGRKEKNELKQMVVDELLPHAFAKPSVFHFIVDFERKRLFIDTTSESQLELMVGQLISPDYEIGLHPLYPKNPFGSTMLRLLKEEVFDAGNTPLSTATECVIEIGATDGTTPLISLRDMGMGSSDVRHSIDGENRFVRSIRLMLDDIVFTVDRKFAFSGVQGLEDKSEDKDEYDSQEDFLRTKLFSEAQNMNILVDAVIDVIDNS